jgi:hypothetical protein
MHTPGEVLTRHRKAKAGLPAEAATRRQGHAPKLKGEGASVMTGGSFSGEWGERSRKTSELDRPQRFCFRFL